MTTHTNPATKTSDSDSAARAELEERLNVHEAPADVADVHRRLM